MSRYDWEAGTLVLPTAVVAALKKAVRDAANAHHQAVLAEAVRLWEGPIARSSSTKQYIERANAAIYNAPRGSRLEANQQLANDVHHVLAIASGEWSKTTPHKPHIADVNKVAAQATNQTLLFRCGEASISFDGAKVEYHSGDNNHQVERARAHPVVAAFFRALAQVAWSRGSGGVLVGNDEYNRESRDSGGGANYITAAYGPLGEQAQAARMGMTIERYRQIMSARPAPARRW